jgi:SOS-response transcriptional repressor LexA
VTWLKSIEFPLIGATAAKSNPWSIELSTNGNRVRFGPGAAVQVASDSLEPVARFGQWALLAEEGDAVNDGDLVAARDEDGGRYLRRLWSDQRGWILQAINPVRPIPSLTAPKRLIGIRKIVGVLYSPPGVARPKPHDGVEWLPCSSLDADKELEHCQVIDVIGDSLDPIARSGQKVLVDQPLTNASSCRDGELAVVEFTDDTMGSVIKRVFSGKDRWTLVSPNPVDCVAPMIVATKTVRNVWLVRGVLFDLVST